MEETGRKKKPLYPFWIFLLLLALYVGYSIGKINFSNLTLDNIQAMLLNELLHPLPFVTTANTKQCLLVTVLAWMIGFLAYLSNVRNYMVGKEFGTARFELPEKINKKIADKDERKNKIFSESLRMSIDTRKTKLNNNVLIIGGSGAGKSLFEVTPNLLQCLSSYIFTDPKGELLRDNGTYLEAHGYKVKVLNLVQMELSDGYNPFVYIRSETDIIKLITNLIANTTPKNSTKGDPFWEKAEGMYLQALFLYVWLEYPKQGKRANFRGLMELLNKAEIPEDENDESELDKLMHSLDSRHPALLAYNKVRRGATDTVRSIIISANSRLAYLENPEVLRILDQDEMDIPFLGTGIRNNPDKKTALFIVIPDSDKSYNFVAGMLYTQIFQELYYQADFNYGGRLPVPVSLWMDEFANIALPEDFCSLLSTMRSREISCNIIIQNLAQIKAMFEKTWETVPGNCDSLIYLGGNEASTHKYISETLGKWTIDKRTTGESLGKNGSSSRNYDVLGRELMTPDEVRKMPNEKCLVFIRGLDPVYDYKYRTFEKDEFKEARSYGAYLHKEIKEDIENGKEKAIMKGMEELEVLSPDEVEFYKKLNDSNVSIIEMTEAQLMNLDLTGFEDRQLTKEEIRELLDNEEYIKILEDSADEDEKLMRECEDLETSIKIAEMADKKGESDAAVMAMGLAERLLYKGFTSEQIKEAELGMRAGLPEKMILMYFLPKYLPEHMRELRKLAEKLSD